MSPSLDPKRRNQCPKCARDSKSKSCKICYGYGFWGFGLPAPIGPMDFASGYPTKPCPKCGVSKRPMETYGK